MGDVSHRVAHARRRSDAPPPSLWEEGRRPGAQVVALTTLVAVAVAWLNLALTGRLSLFFDLAFVLLCVVAALTVRPRDFFAVGVLPPLLMLGVVTMLAGARRAAVADEVDSLVQAVVSGLAHHAGGLVAGYAAVLGVLALRQVALRTPRAQRGSA